MKFYDSVKDRVKDETEDTEDKKGGKVAFEELKRNAEKSERVEEEPDDTEIEDLTAGAGGSTEYGDPSSIELKDDDEPPQAGNFAEEEPKNASEEVELQEDGSVEGPSKPTVEETRSGGSEDHVTLLRDIRDQNRTIIGLLRGIKRGLDTR